ncbi:hypothetical protein [Wolbachia pipientis]|uniref:hypothetical protein n=1 Tax=Wolbachia pipientis TaxID=955 RepID=UPI00202F54EF|nr:hypothetical protein [Wolbachia pipientis]MCM1002388.1 hypothetical protein [Wolbachia pipientis]
MCSSKATTEPVPGSGDTVSILKYSIATLLLCASSVVTGIYTCLIVSTILSAAAVPVLFAAISVVTALVALSSTVYLIKSFVSAVNSERKIDLSEKKPDSELGGNEECKVPGKQQQENNDNAAETPLVTKAPATPDMLPVLPLPNGAASPPPPHLRRLHLRVLKILKGKLVSPMKVGNKKILWLSWKEDCRHKEREILQIRM